MKINQHIKIAVLVMTSLTISSCAQSIKFADSVPITESHDNISIDVPQSNDFNMSDYAFEVLVKRPAANAMDVSRVKEAEDVNSMDHVPASSWYEPRLGYRQISPEELLRGPQLVGPPVAPLTVTRAKSGGGNPGFIIKDSRGKSYLMKFDPPEFPAIETTTALIANRLFWGFGYNVPEDYLYFFKPEELSVKKNATINREDVDKVLSEVAPPVDGYYRSTASYFIQGKILGPLYQVGIRKDDKNDTIKHENRRVLRALKVFGTFTNHSDMRIDNSLDVYIGEEGKGYVKHYLLDFGEAFGGHGAEHQRLWDGFNHLFSTKVTFKNIATFGLVVDDWENLKYTKWDAIGAFESEVFDPANWKETWPYEPIRISRREDDYWAAKILSALTEEQLKLLIKEAQYPEEGAAEYMLETLMERKRKTTKYFFSRVSPIEYANTDLGLITLSDKGIEVFGEDESREGYTISFYDGNGDKIGQKNLVGSSNGKILIPISNDVLNDSNGYLILKIRVDNKNADDPPPAQFHFITAGYKVPKLVGVVH